MAGEETARGRAAVNHWLGFINSSLHQASKPIFEPGRFIADASQHAELASSTRKKLRGLFELANTPLTEHDWLAGAKRSIADAYLFVLLRWAKAKDIDPGGLEGLERFFRRMQADSGVKAAMHAEGICSTSFTLPRQSSRQGEMSANWPSFLHAQAAWSALVDGRICLIFRAGVICARADDLAVLALLDNVGAPA